MRKKNEKSKLRNFGFLIGFGFPVVIGFLIPLLYGHDFRKWTLIIAIPFLILAIFKPNLLDKPFQNWMRLGYFLGLINSRLILGLVHIIVVQPTALIMKIFGYDPLRKKINNLATFRENNEGKKVNFNKIF